MKTTSTLLLLLLITLIATGQVQKVKGRLLDQDGSPMPGVNVVVKGTTTGTVTDINGYYEIHAPAGAVLIFSFVGMQTREVLVTPGMVAGEPMKAMYSPEEKKILDLFMPEYEDSVGLAVLRSDAPTYKTRGGLVPRQIASFKQLSTGKYLIKTSRDPMLSEDMKFQFTSQYSVRKVNRLPALQDRFAQGIPLNGMPSWSGPDSGTNFSWGPDMSLLEFDNTSYPWDKYGRLTLRDGTGMPARIYDNTRFLRTAHSFGNELIISVPASRSGDIMAFLNHDREEFIIPGADRKNIQAMFKASNISLAPLKFGGNLMFRELEGSLWPHGASLNRAVAGMFAAPVSFDHANGLSAYRAARTSESYLLENGMERSFSPEFSNPYGVIQELPDHDRQQQLLGRIHITHDHERENSPHSFHSSLSVFGDLDKLTSEYGIPELYAAPSRNTDREIDQLSAGSELRLRYEYHPRDLTLNITGKYLPGIHRLTLDRTDRFGSNIQQEPDSIFRQNRSIRRNQHEASLEAEVEYRGVNLIVANQFYASSTTAKSYAFLPNLGLEINMRELLYMSTDLEVFYNFSRSVNEGRLIQAHWAYASLDKPVNRFSEVYESGEVFFPAGLRPETHTTSELGITSHFDRINSTIRLYHHRTSDFMVYDPFRNELINAGEEVRKGIEMQLDYHTWYAPRLTAGITFAAWDSRIRSLNTPYEIPVAGFEEVSAMLVEGQPAGAIFGSAFLRDPSGRRIIGADGFPVKDPTLKRLANPIPDWQMGIHSNISFGQFAITIALLGQRGGKKWNGTRAYLDYLGRSAETGDLRYTAEYVFDGVTENGLPNNTSVMFYDADRPISENRWVRYGADGVAEEYIDDTSWLRIREISAKFSLKELGISYLDEIDLIAGVENILLYSAYDGVDPESTLFGYEQGAGLDLFNVPSSAQFHAKVIVKF